MCGTKRFVSLSVVRPGSPKALRHTATLLPQHRQAMDRLTGAPVCCERGVASTVTATDAAAATATATTTPTTTDSSCCRGGAGLSLASLVPLQLLHGLPHVERLDGLPLLLLSPLLLHPRLQSQPQLAQLALLLSLLPLIEGPPAPPSLSRALLWLPSAAAAWLSWPRSLLAPPPACPTASLPPPSTARPGPPL